MCDGQAESAIRSIVEDKGTLAPAADARLFDDLVTANRVLFHHGVVDAFGHVSVRHDKAPDRFLLSCNLAPAQVTRDDIVEFDSEGAPVNAKGRPVYLERFIYSEIYKARPDVMAIVHSHAHSLVPFGVTTAIPLQPIWHMSGFLGPRTPVFEIRHTAGDASDLLIRSRRLGKALADSLGDAPVVLMRGHGATIVAPDLKLAVFRSVYTQLNADLQLRTLPLGTIEYLTEGEMQATTASIGGQVDRAWNLWKSQIPPSV